MLHRRKSRRKVEEYSTAIFGGASAEGHGFIYVHEIREQRSARDETSLGPKHLGADDGLNQMFDGAG